MTQDADTILPRMPRLFTVFTERLDHAYRDRPYFVGRKARLLAGFNLLLLILIPLNIVKLLWLQPPEMGFRFACNGSIWAGALVSFFWVRKGRLELAGAGLVLVAALPIHVLMLFAPGYVQPLSVAVQLLMCDLVFVLLALVFASRPVAVFVLVIVVATHIAFHWSVLRTEPIAGSLEFTAGVLYRDGLIIIGIVFVLGFVLDEILKTAQGRSEEALRETRAVNENLERIVFERTRELEAATGRANDASRAKGDFLANMSHEIRTPLNGIIASSELLLGRRDLSPGAIENARVIAESGELLLKLIGDVLDLSKIEAGLLELEKQPFELSRLVEDCTGLMVAKAAQGGVRLESSLDPRLSGSFHGDGFRLRQILLNLLSNAIKFTPSGGSVHLAISSDFPLLNPTPIRFEVRDTGIGMDEVAMQRLFQRFSQADSSTSRRYGGSGLGLAISFRIVELMGGRLEAESAPDNGSVFHFSIRLRAAEDASAGPQPAQQAERLDLRVLLVEDNAINQKILASQLGKLGCRHSIASDGEEALAALQREPLPDVVLMDCDMPELDGWEATRRIRGWAFDPAATPIQKRAATLPIIALTAATLPEERTRCFEVGMNDYLAKPIKLAGLQRILLAVTSRAADSV